MVHGVLRCIETHAECIKASAYFPSRMSIRSNPRPSQGQAPSSTIDFKDEFVASSTNAALAASQEETVSHILQRLDQLQSTISNSPESASPAPARATVCKAEGTMDLHSRLSSLENIHENHLRHLGVKLDGLELQLNNNKEAEALMGRIASKFTAIESQLNANKDADGLMNKIATKFSQVESKLQSAIQLHDRVAELESKTQLHSRLHDRVATLESRVKPDLHSRILRNSKPGSRRTLSRSASFRGSTPSSRFWSRTRGSRRRCPSAPRWTARGRRWIARGRRWIARGRWTAPGPRMRGRTLRSVPTPNGRSA